jgi:ubiquinol-cytochrome c reductase cytochrome c1 subunit
MRAALPLALVAGVALATPAFAADTGAPPIERHWSFEGLFGTFDRGALQRGFQVYKDVCAACHGMRQLYYRNLMDIGLTEEQVKNVAASVEVDDGPNDEGKMFTRPGRPSDRFKSPFPNANAARFANNGALPPDLSLITKAREGGASYVFGILTGYKESPPPPEESACRVTEEKKGADGKVTKVVTAPEVREGQFYNAHMPGCIIAMPPPLAENGVTYADGTPATIEQQTVDVSTFLAWAAEPELETRHRTGVKVLLFLFVLTGMLFALKKKIWREVHH